MTRKSLQDGTKNMILVQEIGWTGKCEMLIFEDLFSNLHTRVIRHDMILQPHKRHVCRKKSLQRLRIIQIGKYRTVTFPRSLWRNNRQEWACNNYLLVFLMEVITSIQEGMATSHPLLLHQTLETHHCSVIRVQHYLSQTGDHTAQICSLFLCNQSITTKNIRGYNLKVEKFHRSIEV